MIDSSYQFSDHVAYQLDQVSGLILSAWQLNSTYLFGTGVHMGEKFQDYSWIQDFEDDFPQKVILKMLN